MFMVKHVVMWRFADKSVLPMVIEKLNSMVGEVPSLSGLETGINFNETSVAYDLILITRHETREKLVEYGVDPFHGKIKDFIKDYKPEAIVVDFFE